MILITIENKGWGALVTHPGKVRGSRLEWRVDNHMEIYVKGPMTDCYDLACVTAISEAIKQGHRAIDVRCQNTANKHRQFKTETRKLI